MSHIQTTCNACQSKLQAKPDLAGKTVHCPKCGSPVTLPIPTGKSSENPPTTKLASENPPTTKLASVKESDIPPATEKQKDYARKLGITFPEDIDRRTISSLIDQALAAQDDARYQRLDELQNQESKVREELKQEIIAELDANDPRLSTATPAQMVEALENRAMGAVLVTFDPDVDPDDLAGVPLNVNYSTETINLEMVKSVVAALFVMTNRKD